MQYEYKKIAKHGSVYFIGNILQRAVSFIMLPIYTHYLSPADYGVLELLTLIIDFVSLIFGMGLADAIFRYYAKYEKEKDKNEVVSTSLLIVLFMNIIGVFFIFSVSEPLSHFVFGSKNYTNLIILYSITLLTQSLISVPMVFFRAKQRPFIYLASSLIKLIMQLCLNIYFIVFLEMRVEGVIYSALITGAVMSTVLSAFTLYWTKIRWSMNKAHELVHFSLPVIGASLLSFYFTFGDRYFIRVYCGVGEVGIYSLAYKFGFLLDYLVMQPFFNIWKSEMYAVAKKDNAIKIFQDIFIIFSIIIVFTGVGISVFLEDVLSIMAHPDFWPAASIAPIIMASYVIQGWMGYGSIGIMIKEKMIERTYANLIAVIVITPGYLFLIPLYGSFGAALSTLAAFSVRGWYLIWRSNKIYYMGLQWSKIIYLVGIAFVIILLSTLSPNYIIKAIVFDVIIMFLFLGLIYIAPILPSNIKRDLINFVKWPKS